MPLQRGPCGLDAQEALAQLKAGNERFVCGKRLHPHGDMERLSETSAQGQHPFATVLSCSDSRVPVEVVFDQGVGDVFVVRVPGNVCNDDEVGAIEYGVGHLHTPLCVVLGHTKCGAVTAVVNQASLHGPLGRLVLSIGDAVHEAKRETPQLDEACFVEAVARVHVCRTMTRIVENSTLVREALVSGTLRLVGGIYDIETGSVAWFGE